jgi:hypothetical protein
MIDDGTVSARQVSGVKDLIVIATLIGGAGLTLPG